MTLRDALGATLLVLAFRILPFAAYALGSRHVRAESRAILLVLFLGSAIGTRVLVHPSTVLQLGSGIPYFVIVACVVPMIARWTASGAVDHPALFIFLSFLLLLLPSVAFPVAATQFLVLGWPMLLSSYSYCIETSRSGEPPRIRECAFFLLLNPVLVYSQRGARVLDATERHIGAWRVALGTICMFLHFGVLWPAQLRWWSETHSPDALLTFSGVATCLFYGSVSFLSVYSEQAGLAHLQIGFMREIGWTVPERFNMPFVASDPVDFWRRWNAYVRSWLVRYVFHPVVSRYRGGRARGGRIVPLLVTLGASGAIHDLYAYARTLRPTLKATAFFVLMALVMEAWRRCSSLWNRHVLGRRFEQGSWKTVASLLSRVSIAVLMMLGALMWTQP